MDSSEYTTAVTLKGNLTALVADGQRTFMGRFRNLLSVVKSLIKMCLVWFVYTENFISPLWEYLELVLEII